MQAFWTKRVVLVVLFKAKSFQRQQNVLNLIFAYNHTFNSTEKCFSTLLVVILRLFMKNESLGLRERCIWIAEASRTFNMWSPSVSNTFNNSSIMANSSNSIKYKHGAVTSLVKFTLFKTYWRSQKRHFKEKSTISCIVGSCFLKNGWSF